jgi:hypothetical protein
VYQRQLAAVTAAGSSRSRSPTPPQLHVSTSSGRARSPALEPPISTTAQDPYHHVIVAHIRQLSAVLSRMQTCSFNDISLLTPLDHSTINLSAAGWKCPICFGMPRQPVAIMTCGHVGCDSCLHEWMVTNPSADFTTHKCPTCRTQFKKYEMLRYGQWPLLMKHAWELARVRCEKCDFVASPDRMLEHERKSCAMRVVSCPSCTFYADVEAVCDHALTCHRIVVNCIRCGYPIRHTRHMLHDCEAVIANDRRTLCQRGVPGALSQAGALPVDELLWGEPRYVSRLEVPIRSGGSRSEQNAHPTVYSTDNGAASAGVSARSSLSSNASTPPVTVTAMDNVIAWLQTVPDSYFAESDEGPSTAPSAGTTTGAAQQAASTSREQASTVAAGTVQAQPQQPTRRYSTRARRPPRRMHDDYYE